MAQTDRDALIVLYHATDGPNWNQKTNWNTDADLSVWHGVKVNGDDRMVKLYLRDNNLRGPIPPQLGNLSALETLELRNKLHGLIPPELGALSELRQLLLYANHLTGPIPKELGALTELAELRLGYNELAGPIPPELGKLIALTHLGLDGNQLAGRIPKDFGALTELNNLWLSVNQLTGPIPNELGALSKLKTLWLHTNQLTGHIPLQLGNLLCLESLALDVNKLNGLWDCGAHTAGKYSHFEHRSGDGIPRELDKFLDFLGGLHKFDCGSNPWVEPPAAVLGESGNIPAVRSYFVDLYQETRVVSRSLKVVLVGKEDTGKTSLSQSIAAGRAAPTQWPMESTVHMAIQDTTLGEVSVRILDCAGQVAYYGLLQLFLTRRAVYLLVWNVSQEGSDESGIDLQALGILPWLTALSFRLPGGDVILVGNKCDLRSGAQDSAAHAAARVESACRDWLTRVSSSGGRAIEIENGSSLTSCALPGWWAYLTSGALRGLAWIWGYKMRWPCDWKVGAMSGIHPPSLVECIVRAGDGPQRAEEMVLPHSWELALSFYRDLSENGRNDPEAAPAVRDRPEFRDGTHSVYHGMARDELFLLWESTVREKGLSVPNPAGSLEGSLAISLFWRFGVLVRVGAAQEDGHDGIGRSWFVLEYDRYGQELVVEVWGDLRKAAAWATLSYVSAVVRDMTLQYPGLRWKAYLGCPDHPIETMRISKVQRREGRLVAKEHICRQCRLAGSGAAFLASELLLKVDKLHGSAGVMFQRLVDRISEVQSASFSTSGTANASAPEAQGNSIDDQAARQMGEISHNMLPALGRPVAEEDLETWTANLRNLRLHTRQDMQRIVDLSNKKVLEAVANARANLSAEIGRSAGELLQAMSKLGTSQSAGQRSLAREVASLTVRIPSHAVLLPPRDDESEELMDAERDASSWIQRLRGWRTHRKRGGKGAVSKEYRLFFLCGHGRSLAECGFEGKGYRIKCPRTWVKISLPFVKALLIVVNATLKAFVGLSIPADGVASATGKGWDEILSSTVESAGEASIDAVSSAAGERLDNERVTADNLDQTGLADVGHGVGDHSNASSPLPAPREAMEILERLVRDLNAKGLQKNSDAGHSSFLCFDTTMQLVDKAGKGQEWSWVRTKNVQAFTARARGRGVWLS
ncbi:unnamed protein product [Pylaiella littoralis]